MQRRSTFTIFQSTPLMRGETRRFSRRGGAADFNPLPSCEGRRGYSIPVSTVISISIHSPHARGDSLFPGLCGMPSISIHSPHARGDTRRRAGRCRRHISIHSPHARGDRAGDLHQRHLRISIHSPHARGDSINFQRIHRIQGSLYNTIHFIRFREFFQSV